MYPRNRNLFRALNLVLTAAVLCLAIPIAHAEVIELIDKTKISGTVLHYYDGVYSIQTGETTVKVPKEKIRAITFELPKPRAEFSTARKTFDRWRKALEKGNLDQVIDCYALMYQGFLAAQMGQGVDAMKKMQEELEGTQFTIKNESQKGTGATLTVLRQKGKESDEGEVGFVKENGEWKMLPPQ
ncbi:MAG: DUF4878 domain-containing protein [Deltaproteobacteria bacterium]|nr:DUF4878 domain-containing protein [Deltaproteobacteria bacterium]